MQSDSQHTIGGYTNTSQRTALKWVQRYIHKFGGDPRLFDLFFIYYNEEHNSLLLFFFFEKQSSHDLGSICWSEFRHVSCELHSSK